MRIQKTKVNKFTSNQHHDDDPNNIESYTPTVNTLCHGGLENDFY
mgnify:CR=1 FL=1